MDSSWGHQLLQGKQQPSGAQSPPPMLGHGTMPCFSWLPPTASTGFTARSPFIPQQLLVLHSRFLPNRAVALARAVSPSRRTGLAEKPFQPKLLCDSVWCQDNFGAGRGKTEVEAKPLHSHSSSSASHLSALAHMRIHLSNRRYFGSSTGGLILFAIFSLVMDVFKIGYYSSFYSCLSAIKIIYPIVQAIFLVVQVRWLFSLGEGWRDRATR